MPYLLDGGDNAEQQFRVPMIVCSCNFLSEHDVRSAISGETPNRPRTAGQVYGCLGCSAQCGRCARTIKRIMDEALEAAANPDDGRACQGCPRAANAARATDRRAARSRG